MGAGLDREKACIVAGKIQLQRSRVKVAGGGGHVLELVQRNHVVHRSRGVSDVILEGMDAARREERRATGQAPPSCHTAGFSQAEGKAGHDGEACFSTCRTVVFHIFLGIGRWRACSSTIV